MKRPLFKAVLAMLLPGLNIYSFTKTTGDAVTKRVGFYVFPANNQTAEQQESIDQLYEEGTILWVAMMELVRKAETIEGWYLPKYSFVQ